jgi:CheY-like chemotaxis protein
LHDLETKGRSVDFAELPGNVRYSTSCIPHSGGSVQCFILEDDVTPRPLIVCIEDNEQHLRLRKAVLEKSGYDVIGVTTAHDALTVLRQCPVCLVLSDHMLRGTTGAELASKLKKIKMDVPIVVHSGTTPETMKHVDGFVSKDLSTTEFLAFIRDFVRRYCS